MHLLFACRKNKLANKFVLSCFNPSIEIEYCPGLLYNEIKNVTAYKLEVITLMYRRDLKSSAREMKQMLKQSLKTGDFRGLNREVGSVVNDALETALEEVRRAVGTIQGNDRDDRQGPPPWYGPGQWEDPGKYNNSGYGPGAAGNGQNTYGPGNSGGGQGGYGYGPGGSGGGQGSYGYGSGTSGNGKNAYGQNTQGQHGTTGYDRKGQWKSETGQGQEWNGRRQARREAKQESRAKASVKRTGTTVAFPHEPVGKAAGVLLSVLGSLGIGGLGTTVLVLAVLGFSAGSTAVYAPFIAGMLPFLLASVVMQAKGSAIGQRIKRYRRYLSIIGDRTSCTIKELADYSGLKERFIIKDMRRMIAVGIFPQGMIDSNRSQLFLTKDSYAQFNEKQSEAERTQPEPEKEPQPEMHFDSREEQEAYETVEAGKRYVHQINDVRLKLADPVTAGKLLHMEAVVSKILEYIDAHPQQRAEVRKFIEYYLPTTIKLINAYLEFEHQPVQGENITTAKKEIKVTLDTINSAFENLLDGLFKDVAWDISSDISVLEAMLAQEGLTEGIFKTNKKQGDK